MRRSLVLTDESARHPLRSRLPLQSRELRDELAEPRVPWRLQLAGDMRGFAQSYFACLLAVGTFIV